MKNLKVFILIIILTTFLYSELSAQLSYAEGGISIEDPGLDLSPELRRYIDVENGNDSNDGKAPTAAWKTYSKVTEEKNNFQPGTHILFKRGQVWSGGSFDFSNVSGEEDKRIVLGAYGLPLSSMANLQTSMNFNSSSYLMIREFDCVKINLDEGTHHVIVYDNIVHGQVGNFPSNGIRVWALTHHTSVVGNLVYDLGGNDCIVVHGNGAGVGPKSSHWVLDNTVICNDGMEDGIDIALTDYERLGYAQEGDIKVVANRIQANALAGLSTKTGRGSKCINSGHDGRYFWYVGNIMAGSAHVGFNLTGKKKYTFITANIAFSNALVNIKPSFSFSENSCYIEHNTIIHTVSHRVPLRIDGSGSYLLYNILLNTKTDNYVEGITPSQFNIKTNEVLGISLPLDNAYNNDPRNWSDSTFLSHFIPDANWSENKGLATPGAIDSEGNWLGLSIKPFPNTDLPNNGLGWEGPALVQHRLKELGIGFGKVVSIDDNKKANLPARFRLSNYPNPFNPTTTISYTLPEEGVVKLRIYNSIGKLVKELVDQKENKGFHKVVWNSENMLGAKSASGIYFYTLQLNTKLITNKMILLR